MENIGSASSEQEDIDITHWHLVKKLDFTEVTAKLIFMKKGTDFTSGGLLSFLLSHGKNKCNKAHSKQKSFKGWADILLWNSV